MNDDVQKMLERGIGFQAGDVVVLEAQSPVSQATAEIWATFFSELSDATGVKFVLLDYGLKVSEVHRQ